MELATAVFWTRILVAVALIFQTVEIFKLKYIWCDSGVWRWETLKYDFRVFPKPVFNALDFLLGDVGFTWVLGARLLGAGVMLGRLDMLAISVVLVTSILISLRWRGSFNGGSDFMSLVVILSLALTAFFRCSPRAGQGALAYIAVQACTSYFISGVIKLKKKNWRTGKALHGFLNSTVYGINPWKFLETNRSALLGFSWGLMIFEVSFPIVLWSPVVCLGYLLCAVVFHLICFYVFGLNRFLFAWVSAYPAIYFSALAFHRAIT